MNEQLKQAVYNYNNQFPPFSYRSIEIFKDLNFDDNIIKFLEYLANQQTCTPNERKFLDEIREKGNIETGEFIRDIYIFFDSFDTRKGTGTQLDQKDFESNISKLVGEK